MVEGLIAFVGRPNVGKSTIFNRCIELRQSIVYDSPGVTRDRIYGECNWLARNYRLIDTGGFKLANGLFQDEINAQVELAIDEADVIVFVCDITEGLLNEDRYIAKMLHKSKKPVIIAVNKTDNENLLMNLYEFYALGFDDIVAVSGIHGIGIGDMLDLVVSKMVPKKIKSYDDAISFSIIGRPNVGKSSLTNAILKQNRVIVSDIEGTTRDAIDTEFKFEGANYVVIDTAGIRKRGKIYENLEKFAILRARSAIDRSNLCLLLIDGEKGIIEQDKHVAGIAYEAKKPIIIVYNKWDLVEKDESTMEKIKKEIRAHFAFLDYAPITFISAKFNKRINQIFPLINEVYNYSKLRIKTNILNEVILDAQLTNPPKTFNNKKLKIYYASQVSIEPTTFILFVNDPELLHFSYERYIENKLREAFGFIGVPITIIARRREN